MSASALGRWTDFRFIQSCSSLFFKRWRLIVVEQAILVSIPSSEDLQQRLDQSQLDLTIEA